MTNDTVAETPPANPSKNRKKACLIGCLITLFVVVVGVPLVFYLAATVFNHYSNQAREGPDGKLFDAAVKGDLIGISEALDRGGSPNAASFGNSALYHAASEGHDDAILLLLEHGGDINGKTGIAQRTALHEAALKGRESTVELLLQNGADVNARNRHDRTPLYYVVSPPAPLKRPSNHEEIKEILLLHGGEL